MRRSDFLFYSKTRFTFMGPSAFFFPLLSRQFLFPRLLPKPCARLGPSGEAR